MSVGKNYLYNLSYQLLLIILPIITVPYITRILGTEGVGINSFTNANVQYFVLFGTLGISLYGNRTIAYVRDDKEKLSNTFWSIFILKLITACIAYTTFVIVFILNKNELSTYYWIQSINIITVAIDISWLFMGLEQFKKTVTRSFIIKVASVLSVFAFVKTKEDLWLYIFILVISNFLGQVILWIYVPKVVKFNKVLFKDVKKHIVPSLRLFIPTIATQIYCVFDKTLLGYFSSTSEVGLYDMGQRIIYISLTLVTSMGTVMLPKMTNIFSKKDTKKINEYLVNAFNFSSYISIALMFGMLAISNVFSLWFFGSKFIKSGTIMMIESPILILIGWSNVIGIQYMLPLGKSNKFTLSVTIGAVVDIIMNLFLVKSLFSIGAAIATVLAEIAVTVAQIYLMRNDLPIKEMFKDLWKYLSSGLVMYLVLLVANIFLGHGFISIVIRISIGIIVYFIMLLILKSSFQNSVLKMIKGKINRLPIAR